MDSTYNIRNFCYNFYIYFVILAFLYPRGFSEYIPEYKKFFVIMIACATVLICIQCLIHITKNCILKFRFRYLPFIGYFFIVFVISCIIKNDFLNGKQQIFLYPILCLFIFLNFKNKPEKFLKSLSNILLVLFLANMIIFTDYFAEHVHITFLGHIQIISQLGILSVFSNTLLYIITNKQKIRRIFFIIFTLFIMFTTDTDSAVLSGVILLIGIIIYKSKLYYLLCLKSQWYVFVMFYFSTFIIYLTVNNILIKINLVFEFSGRNFVWRAALDKFFQSPIIGYGIEGVLLETFWSEWVGIGFNYAHNQIMQTLLDGGSILLVIYFIMLLACASSINMIFNKEYKILANICLITFLFVSIFDSVSSYCYVFIFLSIIISIPDIAKNNDIFKI